MLRDAAQYCLAFLSQVIVVGSNVEENIHESFDFFYHLTFVLVNEKLRHKLKDLVLLLPVCSQE
jgi:hypothetical protein